MMQVAVLILPTLRLDLALLRHPELAGRAVVLVDGPGPTARVTGRSGRAGVQGVLNGMTAAQARLRSPSAAFLPDTQAEMTEFLVNVADAIEREGCGVVEIAPTGLVVHTGNHVPLERVLAASGLKHLPIRLSAGQGATLEEASEVARAGRRWPSLALPGRPIPLAS